METSFLSGSENLYKYLVTIGILICTLSVYYPLKEKQDLQIVSYKLRQDVKILSAEIESNKKEIENFKIANNDPTIPAVKKEKHLADINLKQLANKKSQFICEAKDQEIDARKSHICLYNVVFWVFFPIGIILMGYGFYRWVKVKKVDDEIQSLERRKLEEEIKKLQKENR